MIADLIYLFSAALFIWAINGLASPKTAYRGNLLAVGGMFLAIATSLIFSVTHNFLLIYTALFAGLIVGEFSGRKIRMTALPQMVALLNGSGGLASALVVLSEILSNNQHLYLNLFCFNIGLITFSGSLIAFAKLQGLIHHSPNYLKWLSPMLLLLSLYYIYAYPTYGIFLYLLIVSSLLSGLSLTLPIGGADMPVVISLLNSLSGWAIVLVGLSLNDLLLIIVGILIGASGSILSFIMSKAMNRSVLKIIWPDAAFGKLSVSTEQKSVNSGTVQETAFFLSNSRKVIIVPGFGMAAAQAQNSLKTLSDILTEKYNVEVKFAIHPVAGRMPGHMNVLLAEAAIPYENVFEMNEINPEFATADAAYVIGANDITNPSAKDDRSSPLYGMPILDVEKARTIFFVKRSMNTGYSGVDNPLFYAPNTIMLFGDAKTVTDDIIKFL